MTRIEGDRRLSASLGRASLRVGVRAAAATRKTGAAIVRDAKVMAPVDTGNLRSSISMSVTGDGRSGKVRAEIGPTANYGIHQELGTSRMAAQPYLFPATDRHVDGWENAMGQIAAGLL